MSKKVTVEGNKVIIEGVTDEEIKFRFTLVDRMQRKSFDIYESLLEANRTRVENKYTRYDLQTQARPSKKHTDKKITPQQKTV